MRPHIYWIIIPTLLRTGCLTSKHALFPAEGFEVKLLSSSKYFLKGFLRTGLHNSKDVALDMPELEAVEVERRGDLYEITGLGPRDSKSVLTQFFGDSTSAVELIAQVSLPERYEYKKVTALPTGMFAVAAGHENCELLPETVKTSLLRQGMKISSSDCEMPSASAVRMALRAKLLPSKIGEHVEVYKPIPRTDLIFPGSPDAPKNQIGCQERKPAQFRGRIFDPTASERRTLPAFEIVAAYVDVKGGDFDRNTALAIEKDGQWAWIAKYSHDNPYQALCDGMVVLRVIAMSPASSVIATKPGAIQSLGGRCAPGNCGSAESLIGRSLGAGAEILLQAEGYAAFSDGTLGRMHRRYTVVGRPGPSNLFKVFVHDPDGVTWESRSY